MANSWHALLALTAAQKECYVLARDALDTCYLAGGLHFLPVACG